MSDGGVNLKQSDNTIRLNIDNGKGQFLALLVNTTRENCAVVQKRINERFIVGRQRTRIEYYVNSMFWSPAIEQTGSDMRRENQS